ncbi:FMN binding protein isoform X2 [Wolffia australiana]
MSCFAATASSSSSIPIVSIREGRIRAHGFSISQDLGVRRHAKWRCSIPGRRVSPIMASASQATAPGVDSGAEDFFQMTRVHQEKAARLSPVEEIRTFINRSSRGMLSTFSKDNAGYPSGSMVDFACDRDGSPLLAVSSLALHAKNLQANPKCSLLVARDPEDRGDLTVTLYGDAINVPDSEREAARASYLKKYPGAFWVDFGDFRFIRIEPKSIRFVSGVATALLASGDLTPKEYRDASVDPISEFSFPVTSHMNKDHADDTKIMVQHSTSVPAAYKGETLKLRIPFPREAVDRKDVKNLIVEMLRAARASETKA